MAQFVNRSTIKRVRLPLETKSYIPVSHEFVVDLVKKKAEEHIPGVKFLGEAFQLARGGQQMFGTVSCEMPEIDTNLALGFRNSYNKSLPIGLCAGASVLVCDNLCFSGDIVKMRRHTVNVYGDLDSLCDEMIVGAVEDYSRVCKDIEGFKSTELTTTRAAEILGVLYVEREILSPRQLNIAKDQWFNGKQFPDRNLWALYNNCTEAMKSEHPYSAMEMYTKLHGAMATFLN